MHEGHVGIGQVGVGYWGRNLLRNFVSIGDCEVLYACDQNAEILEAVGASYASLKCTSRYDEMLEDDRVDGIVVATPTEQHFELASRALAAGKHVFVEKPMTQTRGEAIKLVELAHERDLRLMVGHLLLHHPAFQYVERMIKDGELGTVYYMYSSRVNLGIIRHHENAFESLAPHDLAVALQFMGNRPVGISAQGQAYLQDGIEDVVFATVFFEGGRLAHLHTSWLDPHKDRKVTVVGSDRMAVIDDVAAVEKVRVFDKGVEVTGKEKQYADYTRSMTIRNGDIRIPRIEMLEPLRLECKHFLDCIRSGEEPRTNGRDAVVVVTLLEAAKRSLEYGGVMVDIESSIPPVGRGTQAATAD